MTALRLLHPSVVSFVALLLTTLSAASAWPQSRVDPQVLLAPPLTVLVTPGNGGVVNRSPPNAAWGDTVTLTAVPNPGFTFAKWSGDAGGFQNPLTLVLDVPRTITAIFVTPVQYFLAWSTSPPGIGWVFVNPNLGGYPPGTPVTLIATPAAAFQGWSGGASGTANPLTLIMDESKSVTANFLTYTMTVSVEPADQGLFVVRTPDQPLYPASAAVLLTAPTHPRLDFLHWSGDVTGTQNPIAVPMDANKNVTAHFAPITNAVNPVSVDFGIHGVSPNPARGVVRVDYALASEAGVTLAVLDVSGRVIATLLDGRRGAGAHSETWDGRMSGAAAPEGIYFLRMSAAGRTSFRRVAILR